MTQITLGNAGDHRAMLDIPRLIDSRLLLQANSGGGKSWAIRRILEQTYGHVQQLVIDPEDEFHTLRDRFDYVLAGRDGGDCPADPQSAQLLARRFLELGVNGVFGIFELKAHERILFVRRFLEGLVNAPRKLWHPVLVVLDEAHVFCPEKGRAESSAAVIDLMSRGRKRGFCGVLATQRISKLNKDAAAEANNKMIGRAALDIDMKRAADELGFTAKDGRDRLRHLRAGEFYCFGPALSDVVTLVKVGGVQTEHPKAGKGSAPPTPAPDRLREVLARLADVPEDHRKLEVTVTDLQKKIRSLTGELSAEKRKKQVIAPAARDGREYERGLKEGAAQTSTESADMRKRLGKIAALASVPAVAPQSRSAPPIVNSVPVTGVPRWAVDGHLNNPRARIIAALGVWERDIGVEHPTRAQVAWLARYSPNSSGFNNNISALRTAGLIEYPGGGLVSLTAAGRSVDAGQGESISSSDDLQRLILGKLNNPQQRIMQSVIARCGQRPSRVEIAEASNYSPDSSGFSNNISALKTLGLITYPCGGHVDAADVLFLPEDQT